MDAIVVQRLWDAVEDHRLQIARSQLTVTLADGGRVSGHPVAVEDGLLWLQLAGEDEPREIHLQAITDAREGPIGEFEEPARGL